MDLLWISWEWFFQHKMFLHLDLTVIFCLCGGYWPFSFFTVRWLYISVWKSKMKRFRKLEIFSPWLDEIVADRPIMFRNSVKILFDRQTIFCPCLSITLNPYWNENQIYDVYNKNDVYLHFGTKIKRESVCCSWILCSFFKYNFLAKIPNSAFESRAKGPTAFAYLYNSLINCSDWSFGANVAVRFPLCKLSLYLYAESFVRFSKTLVF